ncbi:type I 3-dehydroquinate dehydratase [Haloarchaeobius amylolyticus]|uniref:type I 3-dehydroquinate dehydratase n=1 Tax=Haloarchaeobius amylolyticus TaxID=1198296 RepID=UPI00226D6ED2|nr:type I 3-dehydroquinate dehydratase [Haloarchaeobius amylolyticus]
MDFDSFVLCASTADLGEEPAAREHADAVEFRMDLAADPLAALDAYDGELPILATNRVAWEGGEAADDPARLEALTAAAEHDAVEAVDLELAALADDPDGVVADAAAHARDHGAALVVSAHDFEGTFDAEEMAETLEAAGEYGDVAKLAIAAEEPLDVLELLAVTREFAAAGERVATMAMGEVGSHSRVVAPTYGSRIGYAPVDPADATAPGQLPLSRLRELVAALSTKPETY